MYFTSVAPAITFAATLDHDTQGHVGAVEVLLSSAICGCIFSIFGGQPLVIVGVTGPVTIFTVKVWALSQMFGVDFLQWYCWIGLWAALMHILLAILNACDLVTLVTRFSCEVFGSLIAVIYIWDAIRHLVGMFPHHEQLTPFHTASSSAAALLSVILAVGTLWLSTLLSGATSWHVFFKTIRTTIADYGVAASIVIFTLVQFFPLWDEYKVDRLQVPQTFEPTLNGRSWLVPFWKCPVVHIFTATIPAFVLTVLFYFDHNVSSLLSQKPDFKLKKPSAYNLDFFWIGIMIAVTAVLGIPPTNGLIPQAPLHVRSLATITHKPGGGEEYDNVVEQRMSNLGQSVLMGLTLIPPVLRLLGVVPIGVLCGLFLFMGIASFHGNQLFARFTLFFTDPKLRTEAVSDDYIDIPFKEIAKFTLIQLFFLAVIFVVTKTPAALSFPVGIVLLVPVRRYLLPKFFAAGHLQLLDGTGEPTTAPDAVDAPQTAPQAQKLTPGGDEEMNEVKVEATTAESQSSPQAAQDDA